MKTHMVNRIVNKYLLHNRLIQFKSKDEFESLMERRRDINRARHKQPPTLNVKVNLDKLSLGDMQVLRFNFRRETKKKISYIHGGYNTLQLSPLHWRLTDKLAFNTLYEVVLPIYPKTPEFHLKDTFKAINNAYESLLSEVNNENIAIMGDGAGGALALSHAQQLVENGKPLPYKLCLISLTLDATMTNLQITEDLVEKDRLVNIQGLQDIMNVWSDKESLSNPLTSPIYGIKQGLPPIIMFGGGKEIYYSDVQRLTYELGTHSQPIQFFEYSRMFHDSALFPTYESHKVTKQINKVIRG